VALITIPGADLERCKAHMMRSVWDNHRWEGNAQVYAHSVNINIYVIAADDGNGVPGEALDDKRFNNIGKAVRHARQA